MQDQDGAGRTERTTGASGLGGMLQTEYEHVELGTHHERSLRARVRRRTLRFAFGRGRHLALTLGQAHPVAIEVTERNARYDVAVPARRSPWVRTAWRVALLWVAADVLVRLVHRRRRARSTTTTSPRRSG